MEEETLNDRRQAEFEKYRKVYRDYPRYCNREARIGLTREWIEGHLPAVSFLDVGCGRGEVLDMAEDVLLHQNAPELRCCDVMGYEVLDELCDGQRTFQVDGAHDLPSHPDSFDLVTCTDVMEHLLEEDVPAALSEIARVARGPVLLTICHIEDRPGKYGPDTLHITVHPREWWEEQIRQHMGSEPRALYTDRVNGNGTWFHVQCESR